MNKKPYTKPVVREVKLVSKNAVMGFCHSSPNLFPKDTNACSYTLESCPNPPTNY